MNICLYFLFIIFVFLNFLLFIKYVDNFLFIFLKGGDNSFRIYVYFDWY